MIGFGTWIGIRSAGADVGFADILVMLPLLALGVSLPTPGGVGGYHALMQFGLDVAIRRRSEPSPPERGS